MARSNGEQTTGRFPNLVPNTSQFPNFYVDQYILPLLTDQEMRVLWHLNRVIMGWEERRITRQHRVTHREVVDYTGLSFQEITVALDGLERANIALTVATKKGPHGGTVIELNLGQHGDINVTWLEDRAAAKDTAFRSRMEKVRAARAAKAAEVTEPAEADPPAQGPLLEIENAPETDEKQLLCSTEQLENGAIALYHRAELLCSTEQYCSVPQSINALSDRASILNQSLNQEKGINSNTGDSLVSSGPAAGKTDQQIWMICRDLLKAQMTKATFNQWLLETEGRWEGDDHETYRVYTPNVFAHEWLDNRLRGVIERTVTGFVGRPLKLEFVVVGRAELQALPSRL